MNTFVSGFGIALLVSLPPGANTALCVTLARDGSRGALPVVVSAAMTDACYALLAAIGILAAGTLHSSIVHVLATAFLFIAAGLLWPRRLRPMSAGTAVGLAVFNPATAALWLSLSALAAAHFQGVGHLAAWVLGVGSGTAMWFTAVALFSARFHGLLTPAQRLSLQRCCAIALVVLGLLSIAVI